MTVISSMIQSIRKAALYNRHELAPPRVILWPDEERLWMEAMDLLRASYPFLWSLGDYDPNRATGPAAWLRYQLETQGSEDVSVIYLPGIGRGAFRSADQCPNPARHLFALQFQGQFWTQKNGKDWTPFAFLSSSMGGLGLDVGRMLEQRLVSSDVAVQFEYGWSALPTVTATAKPAWMPTGEKVGGPLLLGSIRLRGKRGASGRRDH
jgi:hypothetical protein